jgi:5-methyltetrahydrofolate--homocysteine methyltransferase
VYGFWPAASESDDIVIFEASDRRKEIGRLRTLRQQTLRQGRDCCYSLADFIAPVESGRTDYLGGFAVTGGIGAAELAARFESQQDDYSAIMVKVLAERLAEAFAERLHETARNDWGFGAVEDLTKEDLLAEKYRGIRPAPGYPCLPDHTVKRGLFDLLEADQSIGISLTETSVMIPEGSVCGFYFSHPESKYFAVNKIGRDQVADYARRRGIPMAEMERWLAPNLGYEP